MSVPRVIGEVVAEATGRASRADPVIEPTGGPAGNARITAWTGLLLLVLIIAELCTLLDVGGLISWHIVLGTLLVPVALLKTASTSWRIGRYYTGHRPYRSAGPPPTALRLLGPLVVASTLGVLGSGLALVFLGPSSSRKTFLSVVGQRIDAVTLHQALFIVFAVVTGLHLLARLVPALRLVTGRVEASPSSRAGVPGGSRRVVTLLATLAAAALAATLVLAAASSWRHESNRFDERPPGRLPSAVARH